MVCGWIRNSNGKIALVTGGNSGIGLATAKEFVNEGAYVFVTGRREPELAAAVKEIGKNVTGIRGDVSNLADQDLMVVFRAVLLEPDHRTILADVFLGHDPRSRERIIDGGDLVVDDVLVVLVEIEALLGDGLVVRMQGNAAGLERAGAAHAAGLDAQLIVFAVAVGIDPLPDRIAGEIRLELRREVAPVGVDAARHVVVGEDKGGVRLDQEFEREDRTRHWRQ